MTLPAANPGVVRFGLFELHLDSRELRKSGVKIKLQEQPFLILALMLERAGAIVTREQLRKKLWPEDTFVDFDLSLNSAVKRLRQALNDDSENPRFVETLYRRGYRFIAPVNTADYSDQVQLAESRSGSAVPAEPTPIQSGSRSIIVAAVVALLLITAVVAVWLRPSLPPLRIVSISQITHDNLPKDQVVTDGPRLYFQETVNDHQILSQVSADGGEIVQIPTPFSNVAVFDLSPTASEILVQSFDIENSLISTTFTGPLWRVPLPAGSPRRLGNLIAAGAALSSDGKNLVFTTGQDLNLANADGSNARKLASVSGYAFVPKFSPDGTHVRFSVLDRNTGSITLWGVATDGTGLQPLLPTWHQAPGECCGNWTPDGKYFLFMAFHATSEIWALPDRVGFLHKSTSEPLRVTNGPLNYFSPVPSRDGRRLFVVGEQPRAELQRYHARSGQFTPFLSGISAGELDFSRDGQFLAYVTYPEGALWRSRADGSERRQLTYPPLIASLPRWSPDGKRIAFAAATAAGSLLKVFVMAADGGTPQELLPGESRNFEDPNWAPDGNSLIFSRSPVFGSTSPKDFVLVRFDLKNGQLSELPGSGGLFGPRWSPDGRYLSGLTSDQDKLILMQVDTGQWSELATGQDIEYPNWSSDSQNLFFESTVNGGRALFRVNLSTRRTERVLSLARMRRPSVPFGVQWSGLALDNSTLIMRDVGTREIYALTLDLP
jgi:Tol biopolymer transport system component/DNA-binding winged helix-turn-helix (wHTH) protein